MDLGDCDHDEDCEDGLKCGFKMCPMDYPNKNFDCCYKPNSKKFVTQTVFHEIEFQNTLNFYNTKV